MRNKCVNESRKLKKEFYTKKIEENKSDISSLWKILRPLISSPTSEKTIPMSPDDIAKYFATEPSRILKEANLNEEINTEYSTGYDQILGNISLPNITEDTVIKAIDDLSNSKCSGYDKISVSLLKISKSGFSKPLAQIYNNNKGVLSAQIYNNSF